jgi:hypothetical protein
MDWLFLAYFARKNRLDYRCVPCGIGVEVALSTFANWLRAPGAARRNMQVKNMGTAKLRRFGLDGAGRLCATSNDFMCLSPAGSNLFNMPLGSFW